MTGQARAPRARATDREARARRAHLAALRAELGQEPSRVRTELLGVKLAVSAEQAAAVRRLRDDALAYLERADRADRERFPALFTSAAAELAAQASGRLDALFGSAPDGGPLPRGRLPAFTPMARSGHGRNEEPLVVVLGATGAVGVGRLAAAWPGLSPALAEIALPVVVGIGVAVAWWLALTRRAAVDRARLTRWSGFVLADLTEHLAAALAERVVETQRGLARFDRAVRARIAEIDARLHRLEPLIQRRTTRWENERKDNERTRCDQPGS